jgi:hypothetical protein
MNINITTNDAIGSEPFWICLVNILESDRLSPGRLCFPIVVISVIFIFVLCLEKL